MERFVWTVELNIHQQHQQHAFVNGQPPPAFVNGGQHVMHVNGGQPPAFVTPGATELRARLCWKLSTKTFKLEKNTIAWPSCVIKKSTQVQFASHGTIVDPTSSMYPS